MAGGARSHLRPRSSGGRRLRLTAARTPEHLSEARRIVHDAYVGAGYLPAPLESGEWAHPEAVPCRTLTAILRPSVAEPIVATMSAVLDGCGLPLDASCPGRMRALREQIGPLMEITGLAARDRIGFRPLLDMGSLCLAWGIAEGRRGIVVGCHPSQWKTWARLWGFRPRGGASEHRTLSAPLVLLHGSIPEMLRRSDELSGVRHYLSREWPASLWARRYRGCRAA